MPRYRPLGTACPPLLVVGGAGGARIIMGVVQAVLNVVDFRQTIPQAIDAERIDDPSGTLAIEDARVAPEVLAALVARGHALMRLGEYDVRPRLQAAGVGPRGAVRSAVSGSRSEPGSFAQTGR